MVWFRVSDRLAAHGFFVFVAVLRIPRQIPTSSFVAKRGTKSDHFRPKCVASVRYNCKDAYFLDNEIIITPFLFDTIRTDNSGTLNHFTGSNPLNFKLRTSRHVAPTS
jgi:hypothetical protein